MTLEDFQASMSQFVFHREGADKLSKFLKNCDDEEILARLSIYQNNTFYSLSEALKDLYPSIANTIGEDLFKQIAKQYLCAHPPQSAAMIDFGHDFPPFISGISACDQLGYLQDLAYLDLCYHQSYHAEDTPSLPPESFANLEIEKLVSAKIEAIASANLLLSDFAIFDIWQMIQNQQNQTINANQCQYLLIIRPHAEVNIYNLDLGTFTFFTKLKEGSNINDALVEAQEEDSAFNPSNAISFLIQSGFSARIIEE